MGSSRPGGYPARTEAEETTMLVHFGAHAVDREPTGDRGAAEASGICAPGLREVVMLRFVPTSPVVSGAPGFIRDPDAPECVGVSAIAETTPLSHDADRRLAEAEPLAVGGPEAARPR